MIKSLVSIIVASILILIGALYENKFIKNNFEEFNKAVVTVYEKINEKTAVEDDVYALQHNWFEKKEKFTAGAAAVSAASGSNTRRSVDAGFRQPHSLGIPGLFRIPGVG